VPSIPKADIPQLENGKTDAQRFEIKTEKKIM